MDLFRHGVVSGWCIANIWLQKQADLLSGDAKAEANTASASYTTTPAGRLLAKSDDSKYFCTG